MDCGRKQITHRKLMEEEHANFTERGLSQVSNQELQCSEVTVAGRG